MMNVYCWRTGSISAVTSVEDSTRHLPYCPSLTALHPNAVSRPILRVWFLDPVSDPARRMSAKCLCFCWSSRLNGSSLYLVNRRLPAQRSRGDSTLSLTYKPGQGSHCFCPYKGNGGKLAMFANARS